MERVFRFFKKKMISFHFGALGGFWTSVLNWRVLKLSNDDESVRYCENGCWVDDRHVVSLGD